jgi:hypothetical protein
MESAMLKRLKWLLSLIFMLLFLTSVSCASSSKALDLPATIAPITVTNDLSLVDLCTAIPRQDIEAVMGQKLASPPQAFAYYDTPGTSGCSYDGGKDSDGNTVFGYVALTPASVYNEQPLSANVDVDNLGMSAFFNNGADARQLWVKVNDSLAFVVAFGDEPNEEGAKAIARLVLEAFQ